MRGLAFVTPPRHTAYRIPEQSTTTPRAEQQRPAHFFVLAVGHSLRGGPELVGAACDGLRQRDPDGDVAAVALVRDVAVQPDDDIGPAVPVRVLEGEVDSEGE